MTNFGLKGRLIVGPSGAGKDSLIDYAKERVKDEHRIRFARRIITCPASVGEDHHSTDVAGNHFVAALMHLVADC